MGRPRKHYARKLTTARLYEEDVASIARGKGRRDTFADALHRILYERGESKKKISELEQQKSELEQQNSILKKHYDDLAVKHLDATGGYMHDPHVVDIAICKDRWQDCMTSEYITNNAFREKYVMLLKRAPELDCIDKGLSMSRDVRKENTTLDNLIIGYEDAVS